MCTRGGLLILFGLLLPAATRRPGDIPLSYSAKPTRGTVIDRQTGQPLEGVIIVGQWILYEAEAAAPWAHPL